MSGTVHRTQHTEVNKVDKNLAFKNLYFYLGENSNKQKKQVKHVGCYDAGLQG